MLDISFYTTNDEPAPYYVELSADFYEWLAKSDFSKIGKSVNKNFVIDGEEEKLPVVKLGRDNRRNFKAFFCNAITQESDVVINKLGDSPEKKEVQAITYRLKKLLELLKCVENEKYQYLQRV